MSAARVSDKLRRYLLNPHHETGAAKAKWFEQALDLDFTQENCDELARQLVFSDSIAAEVGVSRYGTKFHQSSAILGANGRTISVLTVWLKGVDGVPRLVTAIPSAK